MTNSSAMLTLKEAHVHLLSWVQENFPLENENASYKAIGQFFRATLKAQAK